MIEQLKEQIAKLTKREIIIMGVTGATLFIYLTYTLIFESTYKSIVEKRDKLATVTAKFEQLEQIRGKLHEISAALKISEVELEKKQASEKIFREGLQARNQISTFLTTLESTAKGIPMQLVELKAKTSIMARKSEYILEKSSGEKDGKSQLVKGATTEVTKEGKRVVKVNYTQNAISMKYRSDYPSAVEYLSKIIKLPYTISILSVEMRNSLTAEKTGMETISPVAGVTFTQTASPKKKRETKEGEPLLIDTSLELEIYFK